MATQLLYLYISFYPPYKDLEEMAHREKEKTEVYYIQSNESHGGTVGA